MFIEGAKLSHRSPFFYFWESLSIDLYFKSPGIWDFLLLDPLLICVIAAYLYTAKFVLLH